ncbi:LysR substrate-binding domain-containing protein [Variovorax boronicumulans]
MVISRDDEREQAAERARHRLVGRLRLKHLRLIDALARTSSLRQAAVAMSLTQPAATKILQDLEDVLGVPLFTRRARAIEINDFGRFVAVYARRVLGETQRFGADLDTLVRSGHGTLTIGAIMVTAAGLLPAAVLELKKTRPAVSVRIVESSSDRLLADLAKNEFDFVLARFVRPQDSLQFELLPLNDEPLCIFTGRDGPVSQRSRSLADLHGLSWVIQDSPTPTRRLLEAEFGGEALGLPADLVRVSSVYTMLNMVEKAGMVGVLPRAMVDNEGERFRVLPVRLKSALSPYGIVTRRGMELTSTAQDMMAILQRLARKRPRRG